MTPCFRRDAYAAACEAEVVAASPDGIRLSDTVFFPEGGGQPGDVGHLVWDGTSLPVVDARKADGPDTVTHVPGPDGSLPAVGAPVRAVIDWERRYRLMRMHTALHLLCAVIDGGVTGGQIGESKSRLDFDIGGERPDKETLTETLNRLIVEDYPVSARWVDASDLQAQPDLVRTMSVQPPADASGRVRLIEIAGVDLQPCGGTHVASTSEIGGVRVGKIESKGRSNRRINLHFADSPA